MRYVECRYIRAKRNHYTVSIDASEYLEIILNKAQTGATIEQLAQYIVEPDISFSDAVNFINQLIDNQILTSSIAPSVTGNDYLEHLINEIPSIELTQKLIEVNNLLSELDKNQFETNSKNYKKLIKILGSFEIPLNKKFLFQTDLILTPKSNNLNLNTTKNIRKGVEVLNKLMGITEDEKLSNFRKQFYAKFEEEQVPLAIALDVESGVSYGFQHEDEYDISPLIKGLNITYNKNEEKGKISWSKKDSLLYKKLLELDNKIDKEIIITKDDLKNFDENWNDLPLSFNVIAKILNNDSDNPLMYIDFVGGPSATYLLGRFSQIDQNIEKLLKRITALEDISEKTILAEIAHLPENRIGNILNRSHLREYEIPYLAKSTMPLDKQIPIDDILVSVDQERIKLYSKKHNKEILPRLATAHNYSYNTLPIYQFLCDLQTENKKHSLQFSWGNAGMGRGHLPRICFDNIIISPAQWTINKKEISNLIKHDSLKLWRDSKNIPRKILLHENDNELLIDLDNTLSANMFKAAIKNKTNIVIKEYLFSEENSLVKRGNESYNNECFFTLIKNKN